MKSATKTGIISISIVLAVLAIVTFPWNLIYIGIALSPNPPKPEIKYGEFPFRLEYEIDGQNVVIEDTLICKYDGIGMNEGTGKYRKWKDYLASGNEQVLLKIDRNTTLYYSVGSAQHYMENIDPYVSSTTLVIYLKEKSWDGSLSSMMDGKEIYERYGIKLIDVNLSVPIVNSFPE